MKKKTIKLEHPVAGSVEIRKAREHSLFMRVAGGDGTINGEKFTFSAGVAMESLFVDIGADIYFVSIRDILQAIAKIRDKAVAS